MSIDLMVSRDDTLDKFGSLHASLPVGVLTTAESRAKSLPINKFKPPVAPVAICYKAVVLLLLIHVLLVLYLCHVLLCST